MLLYLHKLYRVEFAISKFLHVPRNSDLRYGESNAGTSKYKV
jgi:hypothetical protein